MRNFSVSQSVSFFDTFIETLKRHGHDGQQRNRKEDQKKGIKDKRDLLTTEGGEKRRKGFLFFSVLIFCLNWEIHLELHVKLVSFL